MRGALKAKLQAVCLPQPWLTERPGPVSPSGISSGENRICNPSRNQKFLIANHTFCSLTSQILQRIIFQMQAYAPSRDLRDDSKARKVRSILPSPVCLSGERVLSPHLISLTKRKPLNLSQYQGMEQLLTRVAFIRLLRLTMLCMLFPV